MHFRVYASRPGEGGVVLWKEKWTFPAQRTSTHFNSPQFSQIHRNPPRPNSTITLKAHYTEETSCSVPGAQGLPHQRIR